MSLHKSVISPRERKKIQKQRKQITSHFPVKKGEKIKLVTVI